MLDDNRVNREEREVVKEENLSVADTRIPLTAPGTGIPLTALMYQTPEQYRESCKGMEKSYGSCWRETFAELRESEKQIAELEHKNAKLQAKVTRLESERNLLALETGQRWEN